MTAKGPTHSPASPTRLFLEGLLAACAGAITSAVVYSDFWRECCRALSVGVYMLLTPSFAFAIALGGGAHSATRVHYYVGVVLQFLLIWLLVRWFMAWRQEQSKRAACKQT
jgi:hypothetical protein